MGTENATLLSDVPNTSQVNATFSWATLMGHRRNNLEVVRPANRTPGFSVLHLAERGEFAASRGVLFLTYPEEARANEVKP